MNPRELVLAVLRRHDLSARQLVKDAAREGFSWADAPAPDFRGRRARAAYAGLVELFAERKGQQPPEWTAGVAAAPRPVYLVSRSMRRMVERDSPAPLKRRNVLAPAQYLEVL
jgi:hypothetical protein